MVTVQLIGDITSAAPMIEVNGLGYTSASNFYGTYSNVSPNIWGTGVNYRGTLSVIVPLTTGDYFKIRAQNTTTVANTKLSADGTTKVSVVKLN